MRRAVAVATIAVAVLLTLDAAARAAAGPDQAGALFICKATGDNRNPGTKEKPFKNIDAAVKKARGGETYLVCAGVYSGTFDIGYVEFTKAVKLYGGYATDFSARDPLANRTLFQPDNKSGAKSRKALWVFKGDVDGLVIDGFIFDMGQRNRYDKSAGKPAGVETGMLLLPPAKASGENATVAETCVQIMSGAREGSITVSNNVFANCASHAFQAGLRGGTYTIRNNVFVANRMAAVEVYGTCRAKGAGPSGKLTTVCGDVGFEHNTVLFSWSRLKDFLDMGYGFRIMTMVAYDIHDNIFGANVQAGIDHSRFNQNPIRIDRNGFFVNKNADLEYSPGGNTKLTLRAGQFGDLELASVTGNTTVLPGAFPVDKAYLEGFVSARYSEEQDFDPNSQANVLREVMGLNKQGTLKTGVSMYGNRYRVDRAVQLFGGMSGIGAQVPK